MEQDLYYYNLNSRMLRKWISSKILSYKTYNDLNLSFPDIRYFNCKIIAKAGWHLSYFGDKYINYLNLINT